MSSGKLNAPRSSRDSRQSLAISPLPSIARVPRVAAADVPKPPRRRDTPRRPCLWEPFGLNSVVNSAEKVEGPGTRGAKESVNDSKEEDGSADVTSTLSGLLAGLPTLAGPQRLANSLRQKFASNSGYPRPGLMRAAPIATISSSRSLPEVARLGCDRG
ncbi:hypothetical protein PUN28_019615 [Cardiocondyla obscurior]|uniref:Uncharacterized protein n=1 Tax=Cardiocondyla obscurior TaxID=286306 RepID=A0AAW2E9K7_9HYME